MAWQANEADGASAKTWPTASTRLNWARNNFSKLTVQEQLQKFLVMTLNLTALSDLIEEAGIDQFLSAKQKREWRNWYETYRPTQPVGRPKNG